MMHENLPNYTNAQDGRMTVKELYDAFESLLENGWAQTTIVTQEIDDIEIPVYAYISPKSVQTKRVRFMIISGIHGREVAGSEALVSKANKFTKMGKEREIVIILCANPSGRTLDMRYSPNGSSVADADHLLGNLDKPACPEAEALGKFLQNIGIDENTEVLDAHEDPVYEEERKASHENGTYLYAIGRNAETHQTTLRILEALRNSSSPLIEDGITRFGEKIVNGIVPSAKDGSMDQYMAEVLGAAPVVTTEILLSGATTPILEARVKIYKDIIDAFLGE